MRLLNNRFVNVKRERTNTVLGYRYLNSTTITCPPYTALVKAGRNVVKRDRNNTTINVITTVDRSIKPPLVAGTPIVYRCFKVKRDLDLHDTTVNRLLRV